MPHWEGIEDTSAVPDAVWLSRTLESGDVWKPLRKVDCQALNQNNGNTTVYIEGGRSTADPANSILHYNFHRGPDRELCSAVWFVKEEKGKEVVLQPVIDVADSIKMETLYQKAVEATSSLGQGIASILSEPSTVLSDGASSIQLQKSGKILTMRKIPAGWFNKMNAQVLQRGYGQYEVLGEETEMALGPVNHLVFVVHGIGEALFSKNESKSMIAGVLDQTHTLRRDLQRKQLEGWKKECEKADKAGTDYPPPPARIEVIPIEWFSRMHDSSSALMRSLKGSTLNTIPALRAIANDVVFDVLMYLTPAFCEAVLEVVTEQINELYQTFQTVHPDFLAAGGKCSLAGHSLGSVICWDLLAVLKQSQESNNPGNSHVSPLEAPSDGISSADGESSIAKKDSYDATSASSAPAATAPTTPVGYQAYAQAEHADKAQNGTYGPSLTKPMTRTIPFEPEHTLFLGSPLGIFLTLRGAHPVFDAERQAKASGGQSGESAVVPTVSPFTLPTKSLYNIFHPSDPVAYRLESLLLSPDLSDSELPAPMYLTVPGRDVRLHVKAMQIGDVVRKSFFDKKTTGRSPWGALLESAVAVVGSQAEASEAGKRGEGGAGRSGVMTFPLGGTSSRVDFSLQPGVVESDYISAVTAHSSYFTNSDIQDFLISLVAATHDTRA